MLQIIAAYESDNLKEAVYDYLDAVDFSKRTSSLGVELMVNSRATDYFKDAKPRYIETLYAQAQQQMDAEKFQQAEALLDEIKKLEPDYGNVKEMLKVSKCEPLYRQGKQLMESGYYRKSYGNFNQIVTEFWQLHGCRKLRVMPSKNHYNHKVNNFCRGLLH